MLTTSSADSLRVPGLSDDENATLNLLLAQWRAKLPRNILRASYYDGRNAARHFGNVMTPPHMRSLSLVLGWSAKAVDTLNNRCNLDGFSTSLDLPVSDVYSANWLDRESSQAGLSSLIHGPAFLITTRGDEAAGEPPALITARDAMTGTGLWNGRARRLSAFLSVNKVDEHSAPVSMTLYLPNLIITMEKAGARWAVDRRSHPYGVPVEPLVFKGRLGRPFGSSRISRAVMSLHDQALRTVLRSEVSAEFYQLPQRVLLGVDESAFVDQNGNVRGKWESVVNAIWALPRDEDSNAPDIKQLPGSPQTPYLEQLRMHAQLFAGETSIPVASLGITADSNPTSASAYAASREDLVAVAEHTTDGWTPAWTRSMLTALAMTEGLSEVPAEWARDVRPRWRNPAYVSRSEAADAASKQIAAVPWLAETEVGLELLGLTEDQIRRATSERRRNAGRLTRQQLAIPAESALTPPGVTDGAVSG